MDSLCWRRRGERGGERGDSLAGLLGCRVHRSAPGGIVKGILGFAPGDINCLTALPQG